MIYSWTIKAYICVRGLTDNLNKKEEKVACVTQKGKNWRYDIFLSTNKAAPHRYAKPIVFVVLMRKCAV